MSNTPFKTVLRMKFVSLAEPNNVQCKVASGEKLLYCSQHSLSCSIWYYESAFQL